MEEAVKLLKTPCKLRNLEGAERAILVEQLASVALVRNKPQHYVEQECMDVDN